MKRRDIKVYKDDVKNLILEKKEGLMGDKVLYIKCYKHIGLSPDPRIDAAFEVLFTHLDDLLKKVDDLETA